MRFLSALAVSVVAISLATPHAVAESKGEKSNVALKCSAIDKRSLTDALVTQLKNDVIASCAECNDVKVRVNFSITKPKAVSTEHSAIFEGPLYSVSNSDGDVKLRKQSEPGTGALIPCEIPAKARLTVTYKLKDQEKKQTRELEIDVKLKGSLK